MKLNEINHALRLSQDYGLSSSSIKQVIAPIAKNLKSLKQSLDASGKHHPDAKVTNQKVGFLALAISAPQYNQVKNSAGSSNREE